MISLSARFILPIYLLCAALLAVPLIVGTSIAPPVHASLITRSLCALPCIYGITPGITTRDQALQAFTRADLSYSYLNPGLPANLMQRYTTTGPLLALVDFGTPSSDKLRSLLLYQMSEGDDLGRLSDYLLAGYSPAEVLAECQSRGSMILTFEHPAMLLEVTPDDRLTPDLGVTLVGVADSDVSLAQLVDGQGCAVQTRWTGFAVAWKYDAPGQ